MAQAIELSKSKIKFELVKLGFFKRNGAGILLPVPLS